jgi:hypothetical protein
LTLALVIPFVRDLFSFGAPHAWEIGFIAAAGLLSILVAESVKTAVLRRRLRQGGSWS